MNSAEQLKTYIKIVKTGSRSEVKAAQKAIELFWHKFYIPHREAGKAALTIFVHEIQQFDSILNIDHQVSFINVLKWPFMTLGEEYWNEWSDFVLRLIQHPSGKIRQAILHAADYLLMDLIFTVHDKSEKHEREKQLKYFGEFVDKVYNLIDSYAEPRFKRYKYVSSFPPGVYKSLQRLMTEVLLRSEHYELIYEEYLANKRADEAGFDREKILPAIKLKYFSRPNPNDRPSTPGLVCSQCGKQDIRVGAGSGIHTANLEIVCENCAIDEYQKRYGFKSNEAAAARRRRIFDVSYLLQEIITDKYLMQRDIKDVRDLEFEMIQFIAHLAGEVYNSSLSKEEKIKLENEPDQKKIENQLNKIAKGLKIWV